MSQSFDRTPISSGLLHLLVSEVSAGFIDLPAAELGRGIELAVKSAAQALDLDLCLVGMLTNERDCLHIIHGFAAGFDASLIGRSIATKEARAILESIFLGREFLCESITAEAASAHPELRQIAAQGVTAFAVMPLRIGRELRGVVAFATRSGPRKWPGDVLTGMRLTVEIIASALDRQHKDAELHAHHAFDSLIARLSRAFVSAPVGSLDEVLPAVLADVCKSLHFDRAAVFRRVVEKKGSQLQLFHEWLAPDVERIPPEFPQLFYGDDADWPQGYPQDEWSSIDLDSAHEDRQERAIGKQYKLRTVALGALRRAGQDLGVLSLYTKTKQRFSSDFLGQLTLLGELFAGAISRVDAERESERAYRELEALKSQLEHERDYLREEVRSERYGDQMLGRSPAMQAVFRAISAVAATSASTLIRGESGVGKELIARAIHAESRRKDGPLVKVNCASVPRDLFESEFFGHIRGSFTGAHKDRAGRFELADRGTIFLDEVGDIPLDLQAKLLRVLQEGEYERIGEDRTRKVNVRVIAATHRDLEKEIAAGRFRSDLYYRLNTFPIEVPPLRERGEDVIRLARHFLAIYSRNTGKSGLCMEPEHERLLLAYLWPGNVRELQHVIERAVILSDGSWLRLDLALPKPHPVAQTDVAESSAARPQAAAGELLPLPMIEIKRLERDSILAALARTRGQIAGSDGAAELLGLKPSTLRDRIRALGIDRGR